jgi:crotonobetainyl-CoA:carnitine CoA-transferase CaiB-like acyl-CoA transferase
MAKQERHLKKGALDGVRVVDLSQGWAGPGGTMLLADQGAAVIKVEPLGGDQARGFFANPPIKGEERGFLAFNRGKRGIALDLKDPKGKEVLYRLVERCDVFLHNFRPEVPPRLGIDYESLRKVRRDLIYVYLGAYGKKGPYAGHRAYDVVLQSLAGVMDRQDSNGTPMVTGVWVSDCSTMMMLAYAITLALLAREKYGYGQQLDASLFNQTLYMQLPDMVRTAEELEKPPEDDYREKLWDYHTPCRCKDGKFIVPVAMTNPQWKSLCRVLSLDAMAEDSRFDSPLKRFQSGDLIHKALEKAFQKRARDAWIQPLQEADVPHSPVLTKEEVFSHPQVVENDMVVEMTHPVAGCVKMLGIPFTLSRNPGAIQRPSPVLGEHSREILLELGYHESDIQSMKNAGAVKFMKPS